MKDYSCNSDGIGLSCNPARRLSMARRNISDRVSSVAEPICGNNVTLGRLKRGWSGIIGSGVMTSSPAPPISPDLNVRHRKLPKHKDSHNLMANCRWYDLCKNCSNVKVITFNASIKSSWFTIPPRAIFIRTEVGFIFENAFLSNIPFVSSDKLHAMTTMSLCVNYEKKFDHQFIIHEDECLDS